MKAYELLELARKAPGPEEAKAKENNERRARIQTSLKGAFKEISDRMLASALKGKTSTAVPLKGFMPYRGSYPADEIVEEAGAWLIPQLEQEGFHAEAEVDDVDPLLRISWDGLENKE